MIKNFKAMKSFLTVVLLLLTIVLKAQTIHVIVFCATNDISKKYGTLSGVAYASRNTKQYFEQVFVPDVRKYSGYNVSANYYCDSQFNKSMLESVTSNLSSNIDDVIFFYYCGHGFNVTSSSREYPKLSLGSMDDDHSKWLEDVYAVLRQKKHRLLITIAEACNREYDLPSAHNGHGTFGLHPTFAKTSTNYHTLFSQSGDYLCTSSKRGQASTFDNDWGYFTDSFIDAFNNETSERTSSPSWDNIFATTTQKTQELAYQNGETQTPIWKKEGGTVVVKKPTLSKDVLLSNFAKSKLDMVFRNATNYSQCDCIKYTGKNGYGALKWSGGGYYFGHFENGAPHGMGFSIGGDGVWVGKITNYEKGTMYFDPSLTSKFDCYGNGSRTGAFKFIITAKGNYYLGNVDDEGFYQGWGLFVWSDGRAWVGRWANGQQEHGEYIN